MNTKTKLLTSLTGLLISSLASLSVNAQSKLTDQSKVVINGIGPIWVGMTVAEASKSAAVKLVSGGSYPGDGSCYYLSLKADQTVFPS